MALDDLKRRILARVPLEVLFQEHGVALRNQSGHWVAKCCFHDDKTPSLHLYTDNHYHCFGCKAHGDAITFVRETKGLGYIESLRYLAGRFSIDAPELEQPQARSKEAPLYRALQEAQAFFVQELWSERGANARRYLEERGFRDETVRNLGFGLSSADGFGLIRHLRQCGIRESDMVSASLATAASDQRRLYDFFRSRLMIPIHDAQGRLIAYGGRSLDGHPAKYVNSRETLLFQKSHVLFGFDKARAAMRQKGRAIVVEGYMDALMLRNFGFAESVGILGTAINSEHLKMIERSTNLCFLLLDPDAAGQNTTLQTVSLALGVPKLEIRAVQLPKEDQDPDEFVREQGADALEDLLRQAPDLFSFAIRERFKTYPTLAIPDLVQKEFVPWLAHLQDPLKCEILAAKISQLTGVDTARILSAVRDERRKLAPGNLGGKAPQTFRAPLDQLRASSQEVLLDSTPVLVPPLGNLEFEVLGLIFYAEPHEIEGKIVCEQALRELEFELVYQDFLMEVAEILEKERSPAHLGILDYKTASCPEVVMTLERLQREKRRFSVSMRQERLKKLFSEKRKLTMKQEMIRLTSELTRLQIEGRQDKEETIQNILGSLREMRRRLDQLEHMPSP